MQKAKLHKMVGRVATTGIEAPLTEPVLVMKSFPLATWRGSKIKVMEKLHDRPDKVAKKAIQKGDWRFILSAMAAEREDFCGCAWRPLQESNLQLALRRGSLYPFN